MKITLVAPVAITLLALTLASPLSAQGVDAQAFHPMPNQSQSYSTVASGQVPAHLEWEAGGTLTYAYGVLSQRDENDDIVHRPISSMLTLNALGSLGLFNLLEIGLDVPVHLVTAGDEAPENTQFLEVDSGAGIGDIRLIPRISILSTVREGENAGFRLAGQAGIVLPTGNAERFHSEGFKFEPRVAAEITTRGGFSAAFNVGYILRQQAYFVDSGLEVDDAISWGIGLGLRTSERVRLIADVHGEIGYASVTEGSERHPIEGLLGAQIEVKSTNVNIGLGRGLSQGFGTPNFRFVLGASFGRTTNLDRDGDELLNGDDACPDAAEDFDGFEDGDGCPDDDNDGDGVNDRPDRCPNEPEDLDGFEDEDGCPEFDNDGDGVLDDVDACPLEAEDLDLFEDEDGCPELDNDGDGVLDADDRCVNAPEDMDGFEDEDGCAELDNDGDGLLDDVDTCPLEPETLNGIDDADGCPDEGLILLTRRRGGLILPEDLVWFDGVTSNLTPQALQIVNAIAVAMTTYPELRADIEVSTRDRADEPARLAVSSRRTIAIRTALVAAGIAIERIETEPVAFPAGSTGPGYEVEIQLSGL